MFAGKKSSVEVPDDRHPVIVLDPVAVDVIVQMEFRSFAVGIVPSGNRTPVKLTLLDDDRFAVKFSTRELDPIVKRVVLLVQFNCWMITAWAPTP
jgi:hypothetical protein